MIPTVKEILAECPWDHQRSAKALEDARRIAAQVQARQYLLRVVRADPPNLTVAHGVLETFWARDGVLIEAIVSGYARWHLGVPTKTWRDYAPTLSAIRREAPIPSPMEERLKRARGGRNRATHMRIAPSAKTDYRPLSPERLGRILDLDLPFDLMRFLDARRAADHRGTPR